MEIGQVHLKEINLTLGGTHILHDISVSISKGVHTFLGPNGAGKTLTNKLLALLKQPNSGSIFWDDTLVNPITSKADKLSYIRNIGYMSQKPVFLNQSLLSNLAMPLEIRGVPREARNTKAEEIAKEAEFTQPLDKLPHQLSIGQKQKLALLRTLIHDPSLLILDEPTASLDIANIKWFENYVKSTAHSNGKLVFWTTHDIFQSKRVSDDVTIIMDGSIEVTGKGKTVFESPPNEKINSYLSGELY